MTLKSVLITGARAPAALELARRFSRSGATVYAADTLYLPLTRGSRHVTRYVRVPAPAHDPMAYINALLQIVRDNHIDLVIPTCEEVFYISRFKDHFPAECQVFCDDFDKIHGLHNKFRFTEIANSHGLPVPETLLLKNLDDLKAIQDPTEFAFKPVYSRFARFTLLRPSLSELLTKVAPTPETPWVAQRFIEGKEYCSYSLAVNGRLVAHACYHPLYRAGQGSGMYFEAVSHAKIIALVADFVAKTHYDGQIAFDFIEEPSGKVYAIECNPRAVSGVHCLEDFDIVSLLKTSPASMIKESPAPKMVALAMLTYGLKYLKGKAAARRIVADFYQAQDVMWTMDDPLPTLYQVLNLFELVCRAIVQRSSLIEASTTDTEWNGNPLS